MSILNIVRLQEPAEEPSNQAEYQHVWVICCERHAGTLQGVRCAAVYMQGEQAAKPRSDPR